MILNALNATLKLLAANIDGVDKEAEGKNDNTSDDTLLKKYTTDENELCEAAYDLYGGGSADSYNGTGSADDIESIRPIAQSNIDTPRSTPPSSTLELASDEPMEPDSETRISTREKMDEEDVKKKNALEAWAKDFAQKTYDDINAIKYGLFDGTSRELYQNIIDNVNSDNVRDVLYQYEIFSDGTLIDDIFKEGTLNKKQKGTLAKHIVNCYMESVREFDVHADDLSKNLDEIIAKQENKIIGPMDASEVNKICDEAMARMVFKKYPDAAPNGEVDGYISQGNIGDCWLLAAIESITSSSKGAQILNNSLKVNEDGSVDVKFKGAGKTYNISASDIMGKNFTYNSGDLDVRAIEIAMDRYLKENPIKIGRFKKQDTIENGGLAGRAFEIIAGKENQIVCNDKFKEMSDELIEKCKNDNFLFTVSSHNETGNITATNQYREDVEIVKAHAYSVIDADNDYVYIVNPWNTVEKLKVKRDEFTEFFNQACFMDLDEE